MNDLGGVTQIEPQLTYRNPLKFGREGIGHFVAVIAPSKKMIAF